MVAFSFKRRFVDAIKIGLGLESHFYREGPPPKPKRQTIRAVGARRLPGAGADLQLYHAQRTKQCFLIGRARCVDVRPISITVGRKLLVSIDGAPLDAPALFAFSQNDGFDDPDDMLRFWREEHGDVPDWPGRLVLWERMP